MRTQVVSILVTFLFALAAFPGCGGGPKCGSGTVEKDGNCVVASAGPTCGPGTVAQDGICVALADAIAADAGGEVSDAGWDSAEDVVDVAVDSAVDASAVVCAPACKSSEICSPVGTCLPAPPPAGWTCSAGQYFDGAVCNCECGAADPDCAASALPVVGCTSGKCQADGSCAVCVPLCTGKACGPDGCGGECGVCADPAKPLCIGDQCVSANCVPACAGLNCGNDGCGGACGTCKAGQYCSFGLCASPSAAASCKGYCGMPTPSGCSCAGSCKNSGNCCVDVDAVCGCMPDCDGKTCGPDGCGGVCGFCGEGDICAGNNCQDNPCSPDPCAGNGQCSLKSGKCICKIGFASSGCSECAPGYAGYPKCSVDFCAGQTKPCSGHGECAPEDGYCTCKPGFAGMECEMCAPGKGTWPNCTP